MTYSPNTEVAVFPEGSQFQGGKSAYLCVFYACADIAYCGQNSSIGSWANAQALADKLADDVQGPGAEVTSLGASLDDEHKALDMLVLHHVDLGVTPDSPHSQDMQHVRAAIDMGVPVIICGTETGFFDEALGGVPYTWTPTGTHCIICSGYDSNGNLIVRDYADVGHAFTPGSRRTYLADRMDLVSATAVWPHWKGLDMIPQGWTDDGTTLTSPNGHKVVLGFRDFIMKNQWLQDDEPLGEEYHADTILLHNLDVGGGQRQLFKRSFMWWTDKNGVVKEPYVAWELDEAYKAIDKLTQELKAITLSPTTMSAAMQTFMTGAETSLQQFHSDTTSGMDIGHALTKFLLNMNEDLHRLEVATSPQTTPPSVPPSLSLPGQ